MLEFGAQKRFYIEIVGGEDNLKQHLLVHGDEPLVPFRNICCSFTSFVLILVRVCTWQWLSTMVFAVLEDL